MSRISRAHPEIADYPFTTKYPNLGTVLASDRTFVVADIPGLIEGASTGHGLGHEFLRHVERTTLLVHLIEAVPIDESDPVQNYRTIRNELAKYSPALAERPELLVVTKMDVTGAEESRARIAAELEREVPAISAVTGQGIPQLLHRIIELLADQPEPKTEPLPVPVVGPGRLGHGCIGRVTRRGGPGKLPAQVGSGRRERTTGRHDRDAGRRAGGLGVGLGTVETNRPGSVPMGDLDCQPAGCDSAPGISRVPMAVESVTWYESAARFPSSTSWIVPETAGADRALAVAAAVKLMPRGGRDSWSRVERH